VKRADGAAAKFTKITKITKKPFVVLVIFVGFVAAAVGSCARASSFALQPNPDRNILLVTIDTLRADALGSYGGRASTPNLDRLASHGARFTFAHAHAVVTLVSHASIFTGRNPYEHGVRDNTGYRLDAKEQTAATLLKARGFSTGGFVGGFPLDRRFGLTAGFDVYDDRMTTTGAAGEPSERERPADAVVKPALDWIAGRQDKWFTWVHVYDPHEPYQPPAEFASRYPSDPYLGEVSWTDAALGPLFDRLATLSRPTLVVVTADHGESLGEHGERTHSLFAYESTLHVPLIVAEITPGRGESTARGIVIDAPVRHVDLLGTMLESAGATSWGGSGVSLLRTINGARGAEPPSYFEAMSAAVTRGWAPLRGVIVGREKFIDLPIVEMYDLAADPKESNNVVHSRTDRARVLGETLKQFNVAPPVRARQETADTIERLRSLGYIGGGSATVREKYTDADDPKRLVEIEQMLAAANEAWRAGRADEAAGLYKSIIAKRPDTEDAYRKLALVYWRAGRPQLAIDTLETALRNGVTQSEVRVKLGQYLAETGQAGKAIALLEKDAGDDPDALIALGNAFVVAGRPADAVRTFNHLLGLDPNNALAHQNLGTAQLQGKDYRASEASLRRAVQLDPSLAGAYTALGVLLANTGRKAEAIDAWKRAAALGDQNAIDNLRLSGK
jgi:arylsulfatase A-like enzyme/Tfp pilus assembly protein PilF